MIGKILDNLQRAEKQFFASTFLAPCIKQGSVRTRIAGIVHTFRITNPDFEGWAILKPISHSEAVITQEADFSDVARYFKQFPLLRVILAKKEERFWLACPVNLSDAKTRLGLTTIPIPCCLVKEAMQFEQILTRFDGSTLWFEDIDTRRDPRVAEELRQTLTRMERPDKIRIHTLTPEERMAYTHALGFELEFRKGQVQDRLEHALTHAGTELVRYFERGEEVVITWRDPQGRRGEHISTIHKDNLRVISAGICLSGEDRKFDLASLVSVIRESGQQAQARGGYYDDDARD